MQPIDYIVLFIYFAVMAGIGFWLMRKQKRQEDYFMGGRSFGKLMQTFAAFGAGTGSADPVNTARGTFNNGMSGMWGVMYWLETQRLHDRWRFALAVGHPTRNQLLQVLGRAWSGTEVAGF